MNTSDEIIIIKRIQQQVEQHGSCSILKAAEESIYTAISMSEQVRIAKLLVKENPYVTQKNKKEIIVLKNTSYLEEGTDETRSEYRNLLHFGSLLVAALGFLVFHVFLKGPHITSPKPSDTKIVMDSIKDLKWRGPNDSI